VNVPRVLAGASAVLMFSVLLVACSGSDSGSDGDDRSGAAEVAPAVTTPTGSSFAYCQDLPDQTDSLDFAGVQFSATPNGLVTGQALAYALTWPYYVTTWPRAEHESWIIVGVSGGMFELQAELDTLYPGARVLAMNVAFNEQQLASLADGVRRAVTHVDPEAVIDWSIATGRISVTPTDTSGDLSGALEAFAGYPVCVEAPPGA
jgi:hypothetical protein